MTIAKFRHRNARGAAFITVVLFTFLLTAIIASVLQWSLTERKLTLRNAHWLEARNAAEAVTEYGFSQVDYQFTNHASPPSFDPAGTGALSLPPTSYWAGATDITGQQVIGGTAQTIPSGGNLYYVDPNNPNNIYDPLKGQYVYRRDIQVLGKATVTPPEGGVPITAYVTETVSVRGAPLFANAIFYSSNDLEIFPGPEMDIYGPVHVNGNMFVSNQSNSTGLVFHGPVSLTGNLYHAWSNSNAASHGTGSETLGQNPVKFVNSTGGLTNLDTSGTSAGWSDSTMGADNNVSGLSSLQALVTSATTASFRQYATSTFNGNLQTGAMGVQVYNPVSFNEVIDSSGDTVNPHTMIDPPQAQVTTDTYYAAKEEVEAEKFANNAGLYVKVTVTPGAAGSAATASVTLYGPPGSAAALGATTAQTGPNGGIQLNLPANVSNTSWTPGATVTAPPLVTFIPFSQTVTSTAVTTASTPTTYKKSNGTVTGTVTSTTTTTTTTTTTNSSSGTSSSSSSSASTSSSGSAGSGYVSTTTGSTSTSTSTPTTTSTINSGMIDQRRFLNGSSNNGPMGVDIVQIDMKALKNAITDMINNTSDQNAITATVSGTTSVWTGWNGGVYVDVEAPSTTVNSTGSNYGYNYSTGANSSAPSVRIVEGTVSSGSSLIPTGVSSLSTYPGSGVTNPNGTGLTIATNAPVYIYGNFNADGTITTGATNTSAQYPDDGVTGSSGATPTESPCCIAGDAITVLSNGWLDGNSATLKPSAAGNSGNVEVAAALLTGVTPTTDSNNSGGAHNLPRFLESWSGTVAIRGSLTCLYSSAIAVQPFTGAYYGAPTRLWGFDQIFSNGHFPPLTPKVLSFRRVGYTDMSAAQYTAAAHALWPTEF